MNHSESFLYVWTRVGSIDSLFVRIFKDSGLIGIEVWGRSLSFVWGEHGSSGTYWGRESASRLSFFGLDSDFRHQAPRSLMVKIPIWESGLCLRFWPSSEKLIMIKNLIKNILSYELIWDKVITRWGSTCQKFDVPNSLTSSRVMLVLQMRFLSFPAFVTNFLINWLWMIVPPFTCYFVHEENEIQK